MPRRRNGSWALMWELAERPGGACVGDAVARGVRKVTAGVFFCLHVNRGTMHVAHHLDAATGRLRCQYFRLEWHRDAWRAALPVERRPNRGQVERANRRGNRNAASAPPRGYAPLPDVLPGALPGAVPLAPLGERAPEAIAMQLPPMPTTPFVAARPPGVLPEGAFVSMEAGYYMRQWRDLRGGPALRGTR